ISFALQGRTLYLEGTAARYVRRWSDSEGLSDEVGERGSECWVREPLVFAGEVELKDGLREHRAVKGLRWWTRTLQTGDTLQVTVVLENSLPAVKARVELEESAFFQASFRVRAGKGSQLVPR